LLKTLERSSTLILQTWVKARVYCRTANSSGIGIAWRDQGAGLKATIPKASLGGMTLVRVTLFKELSVAKRPGGPFLCGVDAKFNTEKNPSEIFRSDFENGFVMQQYIFTPPLSSQYTQDKPPAVQSDTLVSRSSPSPSPNTAFHFNFPHNSHKSRGAIFVWCRVEL